MAWNERLTDATRRREEVELASKPKERRTDVSSNQIVHFLTAEQQLSCSKTDSCSQVSPANEPESVDGGSGPLTALKSAATCSRLDSCKTIGANLAVKWSREALSQPLALYVTGHVAFK